LGVGEASDPLRLVRVSDGEGTTVVPLRLEAVLPLHREAPRLEGAGLLV
jgi:hypothetical protein